MSEEYIYGFFFSILIFSWLSGSQLSEISMVLIFSTIVILLSSPHLSNYSDKNTEQFNESTASISIKPIFSEEIVEDTEYISDTKLMVLDYDTFNDPISIQSYYKTQQFCRNLLFYISPFNKQKTYNNDINFTKTYNALEFTPLSNLYISNYHDLIASNFWQTKGFKVHSKEIILPQANMLFNYDNKINAYEDFSMFFVFKFDKDQLDQTNMNSSNTGSISLLRLKALNSHMIDNVYLEIKLVYKDYDKIRNPNIAINIKLVKYNLNITQFDTVIDDEYHSLLFTKDSTQLIVMLDNKIISETLYDNQRDISQGLADNSVVAEPSTHKKSFVINSNPSENNTKHIHFYLLGFGVYPRHSITNANINMDILKYHKTIQHNMNPVIVKSAQKLKESEKIHECPYDDNTCYSNECYSVTDWAIPSSAMAKNNEQCYKKINSYCETQSITQCMDYKKENLLEVIKVVDPQTATIIDSLQETQNKQPVLDLINIVKDKKIPIDSSLKENTFVELYNKFINKDSDKNSKGSEASPYPEISLTNLISNIETFVTDEEDVDYELYNTESLSDRQKRAIHRIIMNEYIQKN